MWNVPLFAITPLARLVLQFIPVEECVCWVESASVIEQYKLFHWIKDDRLWNTRTVLAIARNDNVHLLCQNQRWMTSLSALWAVMGAWREPRTDMRQILRMARREYTRHVLRRRFVIALLMPLLMIVFISAILTVIRFRDCSIPVRIGVGP